MSTFTKMISILLEVQESIAEIFIGNDKLPLTVASTDLQIIRLLARDCRTPYSNIASAVGITPSDAKERINKMISKGVIRSFVVVINPVIFGYEKECFLMLKNIGKTIKEQDIFKKLSLLGDIIAYAKRA